MKKNRGFAVLLSDVVMNDIRQVSEKCNVSDQSGFGKFLKQQTGMWSQEYKKDMGQMRCSNTE